MLEAATCRSNKSGNFLPGYMAYVYNSYFNLCATAPLKMGGGVLLLQSFDWLAAFHLELLQAILCIAV
jgi:hypothetical protein